MNKLIEFKNVSLGYGNKTILKALDFCIEKGDFIGIVGPNGVGKTTLLRTILGSIKPLSGEIIYHVNERSTIRFGYVPQRHVVDETYPLNVLDVVLMGRYGCLGPFHRPKRSDKIKCMESLGCVGMTDHAKRPYRELSGGQKQRVLMARALASDPSILVLDEPTTDMDLGSERMIMDLTKELHDDQGLTVVVVSHTLAVIANYANTVAIIEDDDFQIGHVDHALTKENLSKLYRVHVEVGEVGGRRVVI